MNDQEYDRLYNNVLRPMADERARLREFVDWIISLDDDDPNSPGRKDRQTITLNKIIERARSI